MRILVIGGASDMGYAIASEFVKQQQAEVILASRNKELIEKRVKDLSVRYQVHAEAVFLDVTDMASHQNFYENLKQTSGGVPDVVLVAAGYQDEGHHPLSNNQLIQVMDTNLTGLISLLELISVDFEARGSGAIIGISSVAGLRGKLNNYIYAAAKAGFTTYLSGLRQRLYQSPKTRKIQVMTVLPGFVATKLTAHMKLNPKLLASPSDVGKQVVQAFVKKKDIVFVSSKWRWIMAIITHIPEVIYKRLKLG
jgi:decaprenylphospho-beta-D-erythro-pentofuranosid-2-ulose 2-reductase